MPEPIKKFIEVFVPGTSCNLKCHYCYLAQVGVSTNQRSHFCFSDEQMHRSIRKERLGGACLFNICADGETMLEPHTMTFIKNLLIEGHYVNIVTNATLTSRIQELISLSKEQRSHIALLASFHYLELKKRNLLETYFSNLKAARSAGISFYMPMVFCQEYVDCLDEIKKTCIEHLGILPEAAKYRDDTSSDLHLKEQLSIDEYYDKGIQELDSNYFRFEKRFYLKKIDSFCYAGDWFAYLNLCTGELQACYNQPVFDNLFAHPEKPVKFRAIGNHCRVPYCYNGVSRIPLGVVPEIKDVNYYWEYRNRKNPNGPDNYTDELKQALSVRLYESNQEYSEKDKKKANEFYHFHYEINSRIKSELSRFTPKRIARKLKKTFVK